MSWKMLYAKPVRGLCIYACWRMLEASRYELVRDKLALYRLVFIGFMLGVPTQQARTLQAHWLIMPGAGS